MPSSPVAARISSRIQKDALCFLRQKAPDALTTREIADEVGCSVHTLLYHMKKLEKAGAVESDQIFSGRWQHVWWPVTRRYTR